MGNIIKTKVNFSSPSVKIRRDWIEEGLNRFPHIKGLGITAEDVILSDSRFETGLYDEYYYKIAPHLMFPHMKDSPLKEINYLLKKINVKYPGFKPTIKSLLLKNFISYRVVLRFLVCAIIRDIVVEELEPETGTRPLDIKIKLYDRSVYVEADSPIPTFNKIKYYGLNDRGLHLRLKSKLKEKKLDEFDKPLLILINGIDCDYTSEDVEKALDYGFPLKEKISAILLDARNGGTMIVNESAELELKPEEKAALSKKLGFMKTFRLKLEHILYNIPYMIP